MRAALVIGSQVIGILVTIAVAGGAGLVASVLVFLVVVVGPGVVIARAVSSGDRLGIASSAVLATGLGISLTLAAGLLLDRSPVSLFWLGPILLGVAAIVLVWPAWRDRRHRAFGRLLADVGARYAIDYDEAVLLLIALTLVTGALTIARAGADMPLAEGAQLWIVPAADSAEVGAANIGSSPATWRVLATEGGDTVFEVAVTLAPGQRWTSTIALSGGHDPITVSLLDASDGTPLRSVQLAGGG